MRKIHRPISLRRIWYANMLDLACAPCDHDAMIRASYEQPYDSDCAFSDHLMWVISVVKGPWSKTLF